MNQKLRLFMMTLLCAVFSVAWGTDITTYIFSNRDWNATNNNNVEANWTCGLRGSGYTSGQGTQVSTSATGANATSPKEFTNISKIVVTYCTNSSKGEGTVKLQVGSNSEKSFSVTKPSSDGTTLKEAQFDYTTLESGYVKLTVNCTTNSIYIYSIAITEMGNSPYILVSPKTINAGYEGVTNGELSITANNTNTGRRVTCYDANGTTVVDKPSWFTYEFNNNGTKLSYSIAENTGEERTLYFRVEAQSLSSPTDFILSELVTVTQEAYEQPFAVEDGIFDFTQYGYGMTQDNSGYNDNTTTLTAVNVTIKLKGTQNSRYYKNSDGTLELRVYTRCEMQVFAPSGKDIKSIKFEGDEISKIQYNGNSISNGTWTGGQNEVKFTFSDTQKISKITVTYENPSPTLAVDPYTTTVSAEGGNGRLALVASNINMDDVIGIGIAFQDENGNLISEQNQPTWIHLVNDNNTAINYTVDANTGGARSAYFKVSYEPNGIYSDVVTFNQEAYVEPFEVKDGIFDFTQYGYGMTQENTGFNDNPTTLTAGNVSINLSGSNNSRYFNNNGSLELRVYKACTMTVSVPEGKEIKSIKFEGDEISKIQYDGNSISNGTWTGSQNEVIFTFSDTQKISKITVTYGDASPTLTVNPANITVSAEGGSGTLSLVSTGINMDDVVGIGIAFQDENGNLINEQNKPTWIHLVNDNNTAINYTVDANTGEARSAYFKVSYEPNGIYSDVVTFNQEAYVAPPQNKIYVKVTKTEDITDGNYLIVYEEEGVAFDGSLGTLDAANNTKKVTINNSKISTADEIYFTINTTDGTIKSASGYYIGMSQWENNLRQGVAATNKTHSFSIDGDQNAIIAITFTSGNAVTLRYNSASNQLRFRYYKSGQKAIQLYKEVKPFTLTISSSAGDGEYYYATMSAIGNGNFVVPEGIEASSIIINDSKKIERTQIYSAGEVLDGKEAYLIETISGENLKSEYVFEPTDGDITCGIGDNWLFPAKAGVEISIPVESTLYALYGTECKFYQLSLNSSNTPGSVGFYYGPNCYEGQPFSFNSPHKAFLAVPAELATGASIGLFDAADGIGDAIVNEGAQRSVYTLTGVRVDSKQLPKGIYIIDGKKQVVK